MAAEAKWTVSSETLELDGQRWGHVELVHTKGLAWEWFAEGGPLGPVEGRAQDAEQARERVEQVLGLRPVTPEVERAARAYRRKVPEVRR